MIRTCLLIAAALAVLELAGCGTVGAPVVAAEPVASEAPPPPTATVQDPAQVKFFPSDETLRLANENFSRGNYGLAEHYYQEAVERAPRDATAWIGLAASYDHVGRFDLADRAYRAAIKLVGETTEILNDEGYSYILRGDLIRARRKLLKAYALEPNNPTVVNNLKLLNASDKVIRRGANP
jgi:Flp pilus assembly protein TadD